MRKKFSALLIIMLIPLLLTACQSKSDETEERGGKISSSILYSNEMKTDWNYSVYLPPSYEESKKDYPVAYFLHGAYGNHTDYYKMFDFKSMYDSLIEEGEAEEMIVVFVDGFNSYYIDGLGEKMESAFINDLLPFIDKEYRTDIDNKFISGLSMGAYGAARFSLKYPEVFKASLLMSPGTWLEPSEDSSVRARFHVFQEGEDNFSMNRWTEEHPITVAKEDLLNHKMKIISGKEDPIIKEKDINDFTDALKGRINIEVDMIDGAGHNWKLWEPSSKETLIYFSENINK